MNIGYDAETIALETADDLRARAARIRQRSELLVAELGADHPLVARALQKARAMEFEADNPDIINLR